MQRISRQRANEQRRGAAATELAILLPFLGLMFTAALDFGRVYFATQTLQDCAMSGALYASGYSQTSAATGATTAAINAACASGASLSPPLTADNITVSIDSVANTATVTVRYPFALITPVMGPNQTLMLSQSVTTNLAPTPGS